jgi:acyl-CoA synthetase (AMP-forming)/AMP-acid ligase II/lauroyl/myristoyl acyltransferase
MIDFPFEEIESTIPARFRRVVDAIPQKPGVETGTNSLSFAALDAESDRVAQHILARRGIRSEPVAILLDPGLESMIALMGVFKAGKIACILAPDWEKDQLSGIWENLQPSLLVSDPAHRSLASGYLPQEDGWLDVNAPAGPGFNLRNVSITPDTPSLITYTSGTFTIPKGVLLSHRTVLHSSWFYHECQRISDKDRITFLCAFGTSIVNAISVATMHNGTTLVIPRVDISSPKAFFQWLDDQRITVFTVTAFGRLIQTMRTMETKPSLPHLRQLHIGGVELFRRDIVELRAFFPSKMDITYRLASTDANQISQLRLCPKDEVPWEKIPVGYPIPGKEILLINDEGNSVPTGEIGEISIRSKFLQLGYWKQPELTKQKLRPDPLSNGTVFFSSGDIGRILPNGMLEFLGRKDNVVRVKGYNIQLERIENELSKIPGVQEAVATTAAIGQGEHRLVAYLTLTPGASITIDNLRQKLSRSLPVYMVPSLFTFLEKIPRTATGKIDRKSLPPPSTMRPPISVPYEAPRNKCEERLCEIWAEILGIHPVGIRDNFYDLGGDSLLVLHMTMAVEADFQRQIPQPYFRQATVAALAEMWSRMETEPLQTPQSVLVQDTIATLPIPSPQRQKSGSSPSASLNRRGHPRRSSARGLHTIFSRLISALAMQLPFEASCQMVSFICRLPLVRGLFLQRQSEIFQRFLVALGNPAGVSRDALPLHLMGNILWSDYSESGIDDSSGKSTLENMHLSKMLYWRSLAHLIADGPQHQFETLFPVSGWEHLEQAYQAGKGVILISFHTPGGRISLTSIPRRLGCEPIVTLSFLRAMKLERKYRMENPQTDSALKGIPLVSDLTVQGLHALEQGQIVQIISDMQSPSPLNQIPVSLGGRAFFLRTGFAEIALISGAALIPFYSTWHVDGSLGTHFFPPLVPRVPGANREQKVRDLVEQYASFIDRGWRTSPESVRGRKIYGYFNQQEYTRSDSLMR